MDLQDINTTISKVISHKCETCGKIFSRKYGLNRHLRVHQPKVKNIVCNECSKTFANNANLKKHLIDVHGVNEMTSTETIWVANRGKKICFVFFNFFFNLKQF